MDAQFYQLRIKYLTKDNSLFVDYETVRATSKESLAKSIKYYRDYHKDSAAGDIEILVKDVDMGSTYFD